MVISISTASASSTMVFSPLTSRSIAPEIDGILAQAFHFGHRRGVQVAVGAQRDLTRQGEVAAPAVVLHRNRLDERAHPTVDDLTLAVVERLRRVVIVAAIPQTELGFRLELLARSPECRFM